MATLTIPELDDQASWLAHQARDFGTLEEGYYALVKWYRNARSSPFIEWKRITFPLDQEIDIYERYRARVLDI